MFLSVVTNTSNPASSAAASNSPFERRSQPRALASVTSWPARNRDIPLGVPWSKRTSIGGTNVIGDRGSVQAAGREFENGFDLVDRHIELFYDFLDGHAVFEVFEYSGHWHPGAAKDPRAADLARNALHGGAL